MHWFTIVLVPADTKDIEAAVDALLEPYSEYREVEPYKGYIEGKELQLFAEWSNIPVTDLAALAKNVPAWKGQGEGGVDERGLYFMSSLNPQAMWDHWHIGGRWDGVIQGKSRNTKGRSNYGPEHEELQYNTCSVAELAPDIFAWHLITPDGQWHEGNCWRGSDEDCERWRATLWELLEQHRDCVAVGVDCSF